MDITHILPYVPNIALLTALAGVVFVAHKASEHNFNAFDYLIDPATGKASITKTLQLTAGLTATWIVIRLAVQGTLTTDMFAVFLAAMGVSEGWSKWVGAKYLSKESPPASPPEQNLNG